jgi:hypothetical protein
MSELTVLAQEKHVTVVQTPEHSHPGVIIQADSLMILYGSVKTTLEMLNDLQPKTAQLEEAILELQVVRDSLLEQLAVLEAVMEALGMALPYSWSARTDLKNLKLETQHQESEMP